MPFIMSFIIKENIFFIHETIKKIVLQLFFE